MNGAEPVASDAAVAPPPTGAPTADAPTDDADCVITTVVDGNDADDVDAGTPVPTQSELAPADGPSPSAPPPVDDAVMGQLAAMAERLAPLEGVAEAVGALRQAARQEFERWAGVLIGHDRALAELNDRLTTVASRVESVEARAAASASAPSTPSAAALSSTTQLYEQALGHMLEQLEGFDRRLQALEATQLGERMAAIEHRLGALEPVLPVVQALRVTVRAAEDLLAGEMAAREGAVAGARGAVAEALQEVAGRLEAVEARLAPLEAVPEDVAALARIVRRDLDAVTADSHAKDQLLRRALQKEIDRLQTSSEDRGEAVRETAQRLELLERRVRGTSQAHDDTSAAVTRRLEAIESRLVSVDGLADDIDTLRAAVRRELERLRAATQSHDQSIAETGKRFAALDGRLIRLDALPGEVQALRSAMRQEGDRTAVSLRSLEERIGELSDKAFRQLRQLAEAVAPLDERTGGMAVELQSTEQTVRALEVALAETTERLDSLATPLAGVDVTEAEPPPAPHPPAPQPPAPAPAE